MESKNQRVESLVQALKSSNIQDSFEILDQILEFQGQVATESLQDTYIDGLLGLLANNPSDSEFQEINDRLRKTPAYAEDQTRIQAHADAVVDSVRRSRSYPKALKLAGQISKIKGYGTSETLQQSHSEALFETTQIPGSLSFKSAELIKKIPSFSDSAAIQFSCAKTYCNITSQSSSAKEIKQAVEEIKKLTYLDSSPDIQESLERAERNLERFAEVQVKSAPKSKKPMAIAAGALLTIGLFSVPLWSGPTKTKAPAPTPTSASFLEKQNSELETYISQANEAFNKKDYDQATTLGLMSLRLAQQLRHTRIRNESLDILASSYTRLEDPEQAQTYYKKIHKESLPALAESHLRKAEAADKSSSKDELLYELTTSAKMAKQAEQKLDDSFVERGAKLSLEHDFWGPAAQFLEFQGKLSQAAELAEKAGDLAHAKSILEKLAKSQPEERKKLTAFTLRVSKTTLEKAENALGGKKPKLAEKLAGKVLEQTKGIPEAAEQEARANTVLAKVAYGREVYSKATLYAKAAHTASPNAERKTRLDNYRAKDAELVTRDELDVDTFVFPPGVQTGKKYTYAYYLTSKSRSPGQGDEELFQGPNDDVEVRGSGGGYSREAKKPQSVYASIRTYNGDSLSFNFDAGKDKSLVAGIYDGATGSNFKNPGFRFNGRKSTGSDTRSRFVVHQAEWKREVRKRRDYVGGGKYKTRKEYGSYKLHRFAADFIVEGKHRSRRMRRSSGRSYRTTSKKTTYGKIRFNSTYK